MNEMFPGFEKMQMVSVAKAAEYLNVKAQAVYIAIKKGLLKPEKVKGKFIISFRMLDDYYQNKYNRRRSVFQNKPLLGEGEYTAGETAKLLKINLTHFYYMLRMERIKSYRKGFAYIIRKEDIDEYKRSIR